MDANGLLLAGSLTTPRGGSGDRVAAELEAGVSREASRAGRLLGLGQWHSITLECPDARFVLVQPTAGTVLLAARVFPIQAAVAWWRRGEPRGQGAVVGP